MIPSILGNYAKSELELANKRLQFSKIVGASSEKLQEIELRKNYLNEIVRQFQTERAEKN